MSSSPHIPTEYFDKAIKEIQTADTDASWTLVSTGSSTQVFSKQSDEGRFHFKFVSTYNYNYKELFETIRDVTIRKHAATNSLVDIKWIENHEQDNHDIVYVLTTTPNSWVVSSREMITARTWKYFTDDDGLEYVVCVEKHTEHAKYPDSLAQSNGYVRAKVMFQVCMFKQNKNNPDGQCDWVLITAIDAGGWVPQFVMDWLIKLAPDTAAKEMEVGHAKLVELRGGNK
jgi:hypothetical protein